MPRRARAKARPPLPLVGHLETPVSRYASEYSPETIYNLRETLSIQAIHVPNILNPLPRAILKYRADNTLAGLPKGQAPTAAVKWGANKKRHSGHGALTARLADFPSIDRGLPL
ncbi:MAG: hypothetical protein Kow0025_08440 [Thermodesulfovibrionales bacterium]